jgi:AcrR family transcriptional regulator
VAPLRRDGQERRDALLDAALRCFARDGLMATGIEQVRREAGASPSSVYHQFKGLPELVLALLERTFERLLGAIAARVTAARTARGAVEALVLAHLEWVFAHRDEARFMYQALALELRADTARALTARKAQLLAPIADALGAFVASGELPDWPPLTFDVVLLGQSHEACRRWLGGAPLDPAWMRQALPRMAWESLRGAAARRRAPADGTRAVSRRSRRARAR